MNTLFDIPAAPSQFGNADLHQVFTPEWAAEQLVGQFFPGLSPADLVLDPTAGKGAFTKAIPPHVPAVGIEIDPELAAIAAASSGRQILVGDFRSIDPPEKPTQVITNPPFKMSTVDALLDRALHWLPNDGRCGLILSTHLLQTASTVLRWNDHWSLSLHLMPRTLFPRVDRAMAFVIFQKDRLRRMLGGFALYHESAEISALERAARQLLIHGKDGRPCWRAVVEWALRKLGGRAHVRELYDVIEPARPSDNRWWQEKVRQTLQRHFKSVERGVWALQEAA